MATIVVDESGKKETQNLEKATHALCKKYVKGGGGGTLHQFRFAMIVSTSFPHNPPPHQISHIALFHA